MFEPCQEPGEPICTYTQGYYGNTGGKSCDGENSYTTAGMITHSINNWGGTLTIGAPGRSIFITSSAADVAKVIEYLPGGSGIGVLQAGNFSIISADFKTKYTSGKKNITINNKLLAQTITLGLNLGIGTPLGSIKLDQGYIVTAMPENGCGSENPKVRRCYYDEVKMVWVVENDYKYWKIDKAVVNVLADKTVQGLYDLANKALGSVTGTYTDAFLTKIASAVDLINNAFDNCQFFMGYLETPLTCGTKSAEIITPNFETNSLKVYPNPFSEKLNFEFVSVNDAHAVLEIQNLLGQTVTKLLDQQVEGGAMNRIEYAPTNIITGVYIYRLVLDGQPSVGRVIYRK